MAEETKITIVGNLTAIPDLRYTPTGSPVTTFTVASTPRVFDKRGNQWRDGETLFLHCITSKEQAENVNDSLSVGDRVVVTGRLSQKQWQAKDGSKRTSLEVEVEDVGTSLKFATARPTKMMRSNPDPSQPAKEDPWSTH